MRVDVTPAFARLADKEITILRAEAGEYDEHGRWQGGDEEEIEILASVQPAPSHVLKDLPEGRRYEDPKSVFTQTEIICGSVVGGKQPDKIVIDEKTYVVVTVAVHPSTPPWYKALVALVGQG